MRPERMTAKRLGMIGTAVLIAGGGLLGTAIAASAGTPTLSFTPNAPIGATQAVLVVAKGFTPHTVGGLAECPLTPGEPTILDGVTGQQEPVGCTAFNSIKTKGNGAIPNPTGYGIQPGFNGPPDTGNDSAGTAAATDAANYPCPPTAAQVTAGASCVLVFTDTLGETANETIDYNFDSTTTTTAPAAVGCTAANGSAKASAGTGTLTVDPATCLVGNEQVQVAGTGFAAKSLGTLLECNTDPAQPTVLVTLAAKQVPVSCSTLTNYLVTTGTDGSVASTTFTILTGTTGPPGTGTDTTGGSATTDAASYPCPPTAAELAETPPVTCTLAFGDQAGDLATVPLSFGGGAALPPPTKAGSSTTTTPAKKAAATKATSGSLAFTGAGPGLWILGFMGLALILLGGSLLVLVDAPRRMVRIALHRGGRTHDQP